MSLSRRPDYAPIGFDFFKVTVSVSSEASAVAAGVGPFAGIYIVASTSFTVISLSGNSMPVDNAAKNTTIWVSGFLSIISSVSTQYGLI